MKNMLIVMILLSAGSLTVSAQKSFIGQSKSQIRNYWTVQAAEEHFEEGTWSGTEEEFFTVQSSPASTPEFSATFRNGICVEQAAFIANGDELIYEDRLKQQGFAYHEDTNRWVKPGAKYYWTISPGLLECLTR